METAKGYFCQGWPFVPLVTFERRNFSVKKKYINDVSMARSSPLRLNLYVIRYTGEYTCTGTN